MNWSFDTIDIKHALRDLKPSTPPQWGLMTAQHMVEHLAFVLRAANGKLKVEVITPEEKLPKMKAFLQTDNPLPKNFKLPLLPEKPGSYECKNLYEAIEMLEKEIVDFKNHFAADQDKIEAHPTFGHLNYGEWESFQNKHFAHHFEQFGIRI